MDPIFDRLGNLFKSFFAEDEEALKTKYRSTLDSDEQDAWDELNDFLNEGREETRQERQYQQRKSYSSTVDSERESLRKDYETLECPFGSSFSVVKKNYKRLLRKYHPDKYASKPDKLKYATEITTKINLAFQRIEKFKEKK